MLSRLARDFAAEINQHDWSDAPFRGDRAGHDRQSDSNRTNHEPLTGRQTDTVRMNAMWVTGQVLAYYDPNFDVVEFAAACGVTETRPGILKAGLRGGNGMFQRPGTGVYDDDAHTSTVAKPVGHGSPMANIRMTLELEETTTWGELRRFAELADFEDGEQLAFERDPNGDAIGLWANGNL